jgi:hypothetical protein
LAVNNSDSFYELLNDVKLEIGGEDKLVGYRAGLDNEDEGNSDEIKNSWEKLITDIQIWVGSLIKTDNLSFLFGAGASKVCGGILIGTVPLEVEKLLTEMGTYGQRQDNMRVRKWLRYFYLAVREVSQNKNSIPFTREDLIERLLTLNNDLAAATPLQANYELVLSTLYRWRSAISEQGGSLQIGNSNKIVLKSEDLDKCIRFSTYALKCCCQLPTQGKEGGLDAFQVFIRKILTRPLNLKRSNIFTLNYDTLVEQATDGEGVVLIDGFVGTLSRVFRPECYEQDLYFPAETTEGRVYRHDRVIHLYKLHGSVSWVATQSEWNNPYGLISKETTNNEDAVVIYPTPSKFGETLGMPYAELFRRFAEVITRSQSTLFVFGYGFGDEHVNAIIHQALAVPSFTIVIVDPKPQGGFVEVLRARKDKRVWIFSGKGLGSFSGFVKHALPDLRDEEIRRQVIGTHRALRKDYIQGVGGNQGV